MLKTLAVFGAGLVYAADKSVVEPDWFNLCDDPCSVASWIASFVNMDLTYCVPDGMGDFTSYACATEYTCDDGETSIGEILGALIGSSGGEYCTNFLCQYALQNPDVLEQFIAQHVTIGGSLTQQILMSLLMSHCTSSYDFLLDDVNQLQAVLSQAQNLDFEEDDDLACGCYFEQDEYCCGETTHACWNQARCAAAEGDFELFTCQKCDKNAETDELMFANERLFANIIQKLENVDDMENLKGERVLAKTLALEGETGFSYAYLAMFGGVAVFAAFLVFQYFKKNEKGLISGERASYLTVA